MTDAKRAAAEKAVQLVQAGMTVGLGSGSTAAHAIRALGRLVSEGLAIKAVASSLKSEQLAREVGIPVYDPTEVSVIDIAIDGADEVDVHCNLIKGGGGSLLREKILACASQRFHVVVDESKVVSRLGSFPLAVEILPFAHSITLKQIRTLQCEPVIRAHGNGPFLTDNGNYIADCMFFNGIDEPESLDARLKMIPGVVETGLFSTKVVTSVFVGYATGEVREIKVGA